jgi:hypothetical protein
LLKKNRGGYGGYHLRQQHWSRLLGPNFTVNYQCLTMYSGGALFILYHRIYLVSPTSRCGLMHECGCYRRWAESLRQHRPTRCTENKALPLPPCGILVLLPWFSTISCIPYNHRTPT